MIEIDISVGMITLRIPDLPLGSPLRDALDDIRATFNVYDIGSFTDVRSAVSDKKDGINGGVPYVRVAFPKSEIELLPQWISALNDKNGNPILPAGAIFTSTEIVQAFRDNYV